MFINEDTEKKDVLTVCATLCKTSYGNKTLNYTARTKICVDRLSFKLYPYFKESSLEKEINIASNRKFKLLMNVSQGNLRIIVSKLALDKLCLVDCRITLVHHSKQPSEGSWQDIACCRHFFSGKQSGSDWEFPSATLKNELEINLRHKSLNYFPKKLTAVYCEFSCPNGSQIPFRIPKNEYSPFLSTNERSVHRFSLKEDMLTLFSNKKFSDVKFKIDDRIVEAHKNVLAARSPVFDAMFNQDMAESSSGIVDIADMGFHTLQLFLQYLYTDSVEEMNDETAADLLIVAEKYQVLALKRKCSMFLKSKISIEKVLEILSLADAVDDENLTSASIDFVVENSSKILQMPQWLEWMKKNMELATIIFSNISSKLSQQNN